jgi:hypothetical protein
MVEILVQSSLDQKFDPSESSKHFYLNLSSWSSVLKDSSVEESHEILSRANLLSQSSETHQFDKISEIETWIQSSKNPNLLPKSKSKKKRDLSSSGNKWKCEDIKQQHSCV